MLPDPVATCHPAVSQLQRDHNSLTLSLLLLFSVWIWAALTEMGSGYAGDRCVVWVVR